MDTSKLAQELSNASDAYYAGDPIMSDAEFDKKRAALAAADPNHPFLAQVGSSKSHLSKVEHYMPMGSLNNADDEAAFVKWLHTGPESHDLVLSHKMDGCSIELVYRSGKLVQASTRGNGIEGELVTDNVRKFPNVPSKLKKPFTGSIRAEAILYKDDFANHFDSANPRNAGTGTVRRSDGTGNEYMRAICFDIASHEETFESEMEKFEYMQALGLEVVDHWHCVGKNAAVQAYNTEVKRRPNLNWEIDGIVCKVNNIAEQEAMGVRNNRPKGAVAWKFKAQETTSILRKVEWTVGHSGNIVPTGKYDPVEIGGVTTTSALLNNPDEIGRLGCQIGDEVTIIRAGDVIPKIINVAMRGKTRTPINIPSSCPECGKKTAMDGANLKCSNVDECDGILRRSVRHWMKSLEIKHIGDSTERALYSAGVVVDPADLYTMDVKTLAQHCSGEKVATRILGEIDKKRKLTLPQFFGSLGIRLLGKRVVEEIMKVGGPKTFKEWRDVTYEDLIGLDGVAEIKAQTIADGMEDRRALIDKLISVGVTIVQPVVKKAASAKLSGQSFVFTGAINAVKDDGKRYTRKDMQKLVKDNGGDAPSSVRGDTTYLVVADPTTTSSKAVKARKLGVTILSEDDFFEMVK